MALPDSEAETLALFDTPARLHIEELLSQRRVLLQNQLDGSLLEARVAGNRPRPYQVLIQLGLELNQSTAQCDCQDINPCIHIGAVWIFRLRQRAGELSAQSFSRQIGERMSLSVQSVNAANPAAGDQTTPNRMESNPLEEPLPEPRPLTLPAGHHKPSDTAKLREELAGILEAVSPPVDTPIATTVGERWSLGFQLEQQTIPTMDVTGKSSGFKRRHVLKPCLVFLRRDGQSGRIRSFDPSLLSEAVSDTDQFWLKLLLSQGGQLDVGRMFLLCRQVDGPIPPQLRGETGAILNIIAIDSLELRFRPHALAWGATELDFRAELLAIIGAKLLPIRSWEIGLGQLILIGNDSWLAEFKGDDRLGQLLELLVSRRMHLDKPAIDYLRDKLLIQPIPNLTIRFIGENLQRSLCRGLVVLSLESSAQGIWANNRQATYIRAEVEWEFDQFPPDLAAASDWMRLIGIDGETGEAILWVRDLDWEQRVLLWLRQQLAELLAPEDRENGQSDYDPSPVRIDGKFHALPDKNGQVGQIRFLDELRSFRVNNELKEFLRTWGRTLMEAGFAIRLHRDGQASAKGRIHIETDNGMDWLDIEAFIASQPRGKGSPGARKRAARKAKAASLTAERREELSAIQDLLSSGIVRTESRLILLSPEDTALLQRLLSLGLAPGQRHRIHANDINSLSALPPAETSHLRVVQRAKQMVDRLANLDRFSLEETPIGFGATLRGYQRHGFSWLVHMHQVGLGACLADDMGLGKTVQALALVKYLADQSPQTLKVLIIAPVSTLPNWVSECRRFIPDISLMQHLGSQRSNSDVENFQRSIQQSQIVIVSYATLRNDSALFAATAWDLAIADEAQHLKNPDSQIFLALSKLQAKQRISLTGTPVENNLRDLWAQMDFINPGMLGSQKRFQARFVSSIEEKLSSHTLATLRQIIAPFMLRRRKAEVAPELPAKEEIILYCDLAPAQRALYQDIKDSYLLKIEDAAKDHHKSGTAMTILEALLRLRQACLFPEIINPEWAAHGSAKSDLLADTLSQLHSEGHKTLVFSQFTSVLDQIEINLGSMNWPKGSYARLDGQTKDRAQPVAQFQENESCRLLLISTKAGGFGINLTAADYVILFDPWWNPAVENQAIDRAHRIGRDRPVIVYRIIARDTVEEKMLALQNRKRELAASLTDQDDELIERLSPAELRALLG